MSIAKKPQDALEFKVLAVRLVRSGQINEAVLRQRQVWSSDEDVH